jgi:D-alanine-D-alanine ligase
LGEALAVYAVHDQVAAAEESLGLLGFRTARVPFRGDLHQLLVKLRRIAPDAVLNLCEGDLDRRAWEHLVPAILELGGWPYTGSPPEALALAQDKHRFNACLRGAGVPTPPGLACWERPAAAPPFPAPWLVKPAREDGSLGISQASVVASLDELQERVAAALGRFGAPVLVERYIRGREVNAALLGGEVLPFSEVDFAGLPEGLHPICGVEAKWLSETPHYRHTRTFAPAVLEPGLAARVAELARAAAALAGCRDYARIDFRVHPEEGPYVIEVNPNPDLSPDGGFCISAAAAGLSHSAVIGRLVELALARTRATRVEV